MNILDFEGCATPVVMCDGQGRVIDKNPAAKRLSPTLRKGSILNISPPLCRLPQGRCFAVHYEGAVWLLFCDFLRFEFDGAIFPTVREALTLSGTELLKATAEHCALRKSPDQRHVAKLRDLLYRKFSFIFSAPADPYKVHSTARLLRGFDKVLSSTRISFTSDGGSSGLVNTRNATILLTALSSIMLSHIAGRVRADARSVGDDLRLSVSATTDIPFQCSSGDDLTGLCQYFPEHTADLFSADLCVRTCGYSVAYETDENGRINIDIYLKTETDLYALLDPAEKIPFEEELALIAKELC